MVLGISKSCAERSFLIFAGTVLVLSLLSTEANKSLVINGLAVEGHISNASAMAV